MADHFFKRKILIILLCSIIGFGLRFYTYDQKSLWMDEIHTYNDSIDGFKDQIKFYKKNPTYLHPPLFFLLTHLFHPFVKPERDLRIIPLISGTFSIPMMYLLAEQFAPSIAIPSTIALALMSYHISLSQDGRSYSLLMLLGLTGLYFFMRYFSTLRRRNIFLVAFCFILLFYTSYSSIPFIVFSQLLWFYKPYENTHPSPFKSFLILNGLILLFCLPWIILMLLNYKGQEIMDPFHTEGTGSLLDIFYSIIHDWAPQPPLIILSILLLFIYPFSSSNKRNSLIVLGMFLSPMIGLYLFCRLLGLTHFISSRYFINFLPFFLIIIFSSLKFTELRFVRLKGSLRLTTLFLGLLIASNLLILPFYYRHEKQDLRGLADYLKNHLKQGDKIFVGTTGYIPGILHYFKIHPEKRHHNISFSKISEDHSEYYKTFLYQGHQISIHYSKKCCSQYVEDGTRLWIIVGKWTAKQIKESSPAIFKGYFDGSFLNFNRFPTDASMYLFLWDPNSPNEKGIDLPIE